ncbi:CPBP family intramembrane metalloprotease [Halorubrum sp. BOL3-1]|uniref:CPBP family intramembrane glutamic endopeptidase n=1 Tax=Halorubrum sp. BOL3-1 TaxID=2497325 RepID=UPI0010050FBB|nr:CPBP family intramembrane glutamic endopeptidase [Halorubrum sp. BOL3-1]QAU14105.1 CPBP family intramembrane metalloprotease [Halorubrum sp. BOL3-1]
MADQSSTLPGALSRRVPGQSGIVRTITVVAGIVVSALVVNLVATLVAASAAGSDVSETIPFATVVAASELAFLLVGVGYLRFRSSFHLPVRTPTKQAIPYLAGGLIAGLVAVGLQFAITDAVIPAIELSPGFTEYSNIGRVTGSGLVVGAVLSVVLIGPVEEFLFRGIIQERLLEALSPVSAVGIASVVFAFFHFYPVALLSPPPVVLIHMAGYYTVMGVIFGWVYYHTDTLVAPALVHGLFNAVLFVSPLLG